ncbi:hypothetical protein BJX99DRAFT_265487 [Aspergillus californicus]
MPSLGSYLARSSRPVLARNSNFTIAAHYSYPPVPTISGLSSSGNGYSGPLADLLCSPAVDFIGSLRDSSMQDTRTKDIRAPGCQQRVVAQIIFSTDTGMQARTDVYNAAVKSLVEESRETGEHIMAVDMSGLHTAEGLVDEKHPNDAVNALGETGETGTVADLIQVWSAQGEVTPGVTDATRDKLHFANIDGDGNDDYLIVSSDGAVRAWLNNGNIATPVSTAVGLSSAKVQTTLCGYWLPFLGVFANTFFLIQGDGLDDYVVVYDGGSVEAWLNNGNLEQQPESSSWDEIGVIAARVQDQGGVILAVLGCCGGLYNKCAHDGGGPENGGGNYGGDWCDRNSVVTAETWQNESANDYFTKWWDDNDGTTNFAVDFGVHWGLGQTFRCSPPTPARAAVHFNQFVMRIRDALHLTNTQYSTLQVAIEQDFDPGSTARQRRLRSPKRNYSHRRCASCLARPCESHPYVFRIVYDLQGIMGGAARSITATVQASDVRLSNIAEGRVPNCHDAGVSDWLFKFILAELVNFIWKKQGTWITAIPLAEDEYDNAPGNGDSRLNMWKAGKATSYSA